MPALPTATVLSLGRFDEALVTGGAPCDLSPLVFIDAYGLVGTACALEAAVAAHEAPEVRLPNMRGTRSHLGAMGLGVALDRLGLGGSLTAPQSGFEDVVVPLRIASDAGGAQTLSHLLWAQLEPHAGPQVLAAVTESVWEMVANAQEHSGASAYVMGQVYTTAKGGRPPDHDDRVQVVIGDSGKGIRESFLETSSRRPTDDIDAIDAALEYLVSSVDDPGRGQGLHTTMEEITGLGGKMVVRSGTGKVTLEGSDRRAERVEELPGVIVALSAPLYPA